MFHCCRITGHHHRQRTRRRTARPAGDRAIHHHATKLAKRVRNLRHERHADCAGVDQDPHCATLQETVLTEHNVTERGQRGQRHHHDFRQVGQCARILSAARLTDQQRRHVGFADVVNGKLVPCIQQLACHWLAHIADAEISDMHGRVSPFGTQLEFACRRYSPAHRAPRDASWQLMAVPANDTRTGVVPAAEEDQQVALQRLCNSG
jgi:hypothetical protein